ncbi:unnamed protein product [Choristocarpus tenellus]
MSRHLLELPLPLSSKARDSVWRPVSDVLTVMLPFIAFVRSLFLGRNSRCKLVSDWFRLMAVTYLFRCLCVTLTSLPGPAPHCESYELYHPPANWHDVAIRLGPLVGDFRTCGDLIFSGHTAWTTITMLLIAKSFNQMPHVLYFTIRVLGVMYLLIMCACTIAGRKHYTVDIALGIMIASLTFFRFQDGWTSDDADWSLTSHMLAYRWSNPEGIKGGGAKGVGVPRVGSICEGAGSAGGTGSGGSAGGGILALVNAGGGGGRGQGVGIRSASWQGRRGRAGLAGVGGPMIQV